MSLSIRSAESHDAALILQFIVDLATYEKLEHQVEATADDLVRALFDEQPRVFCEIAEWDGRPAGFALWFYTFSTFRGQHGIWLEDLFVRPECRGKGIGKALLVELARRCVGEGLARFEWNVLDWNAPSIHFYKAQGAVLKDDWTTCRVDGEALLRLAGK